MVTLPSSFSGGMAGAVESIKRGQLPQSVTSPVVNPAQVKQTTKLPVKKTGYVPLTREQFMKAQSSGFTPDQIIEMEKRRKKEQQSGEQKLVQGITRFQKSPWENIRQSGIEAGKQLGKGLIQPVLGLGKGLYKAGSDVVDLADLSMEKAPEDRGIIQKTLANVGTGIKEYATADIKNLREEPSAGNFGALFNPISEAKVGAAARVVNRGLADFIGSAMQTALTPEAQQTVATTLAPIGAVFETVLSKVPEGDRRDTAEALLNLLPLKVPGAKNLATGAKTIGTKSMGLLDNIRTSPVGRPIESIVGKGIDLATTRPSFLPTAEKAIAKNVDTLTQVNIGTRAKDTVVRNQTRGFDPYKDIATHQEALPTVTKEGKIITKGEGNAVSRVEDAIYGINDKLTEAIKSEGVRIPLDEFQARALNSAKQYLEEGDLYNKIIKQIRSDFEVYKRFTDEQGRIDLAKVNEIKKAKYGRSNYANPDVDLGNKTVGRAAKELVEENATGAEVKSINNEMARWYAVRDLLEAMDGKTVKGGRLGKYSARIAGNIIGSYFGPFGALAGGEISTAIQSGIMKGALKDTGMGIQTPDIIKNLGKKPIELPPSQTSSSKKANIPTPKQPAQASVLPIKEKELGTSQKVSLEKVNNPIIQKLPKKQETPKTPEDWTKKDFTKATETKNVDKFGNTVVREQGKTSAIDSITVGGKKYTNLDIPDSSRELYELDGKVYEYKNGKMIPEGAKTPQVEVNDFYKERLAINKKKLEDTNKRLKELNDSTDTTLQGQRNNFAEKRTLEIDKKMLEDSIAGFEETLGKSPQVEGKTDMYRYANEVNKNSDIIRGGTWYGDKDQISRYKNSDKEIKLGGEKLFKEVKKFDNPFIIEGTSHRYDIMKEIQMNKADSEVVKKLESLFGDDYKKVIDVIYEKDDANLLKLIKDDLDSAVFNMIKKQGFYNQKTMWLDNILSKKLQEKGYDGFIRKIDGKDFEIFKLPEKKAQPLSSKSEVKYSEPDSLVKEARKYKSAEEFASSDKHIIDRSGELVKVGDKVTFARGGSEFNGKLVKVKNFDGSYDSVSTKGKDFKYYSPEVVVEATEDVYNKGGFPIHKKGDKFNVGMYQINEYKDGYKPVKTKSQLTDIWNKANKGNGQLNPLLEEAKKYKSAEEFVKAIDNQGDKTLYAPQVEGKTEFTNPIDGKVQDPLKIPEGWASYTTAQKNEWLKAQKNFTGNKSSLPLSQKSEVKYSESIKPELEPLKEFLTKQKNYDDKFAELSVKANEIAKEYPGVMGTISEEGRKIPANKKILEDLAYYKKLSQDFNSLESSKKFIKQLGKMDIMERKALRNSIK